MLAPTDSFCCRFVKCEVSSFWPVFSMKRQSTSTDSEPKKSKHALPTHETLQDIQTASLFKSNLFKLQMDELISESRPKAKNVNQVLFDIKSIIEKIDPVSVSVQESFSFHPPYPSPPKNQNYKLIFDKPSKIALVGSHLLNNSINADPNIDLAGIFCIKSYLVQMPNEIFQEKDFLNLRYCYKRAFYLSVIAQKLMELNVFSMQYVAHQNDIRRPILVLTSKPGDPAKYFSKHGMKIRIFPVISASVFPPTKLSPLKNNVRPESDEQALPTPHYNTTILQDTSMIAHLNMLNTHASEAPGFTHACMLLKIWLHQRGLSKNRYGYGINGFIISMVIAHLLSSKSPQTRKPMLSKNLSSYQILKSTLMFLSSHDFSKSPLFLTESGEQVNELFSSKAFLDSFDVAIVDQSGTTNLTSHVSKSAMNEFQYEAKLACELLNDSNQDNFASLFLTKIDTPLFKYDNVFR